MKQIIFSIVVVISCFFPFNLALAEATDTPLIDRRLENQQRRIDQGIASGSLKKGEARALKMQQEHINNILDNARADGVVTNRERTRLTNKLNKTNRNIARKKNNPRRVR